MEISFGIPTRRTRTVKVEKYPATPVVTMHERPEERGAYKFEFNKLALEKLGFECSGEENVALGFQDDRIFIANVSDSAFSEGGYRVAKQGSFSNSKVYEYIEATFELDTAHRNYFEIQDAPDVSTANTWELVLISGEEGEESIADEGAGTTLHTETVTEEVHSGPATIDLD